jgi:hypothetical protein
MTGDIVYSTLLDYIRKDKRGLSLTPDEFNTVSRIVDKRILLAFCSRFEDDIEISSHMGMLKVLDYPVTLASGIATLPTNYFRMISDPHYTDTSVTPNKTRYIDVVTSLEHTYRERDYLTQSSLKYPTCVVGAEDANKVLELRVYPNTITSIFIDYIRDTQSPYLDYYVNTTTLQVVYLTEGEQNVTIPTGCVYRDGSTGIKNSLTKNWEWDLHELPWIIAYFYQALGGIIPDDGLLQIGVKDSQEIQTGKIW